MRIRALIVDDEPLARERIHELLKADPDFEVVGEATNGREAVAAVDKHRPDLMFLDVQMPEMTGFDVLQAVKPAHMPVVIFVTAYDKYALKAFDAHALDYVLKPFDAQRFHKAMDRAKERLSSRNGGELRNRLLALLKDVKSEPKHLDRLVIKSGGRVIFLRTDEIDWIEAAGNYLRLHVGKDAHLLRETMANMESKLNPEKFLRIHRSTIVNIERIKELQPWFGGEYVVIMRDGKQVTLSRGYRDKLQQLLGKTI